MRDTVSWGPVEIVVSSGDRLGEGAKWVAHDASLYWVDVLRPSRLQAFSPASGQHRIWDAPEMILSLAPATSGGLIVASDRHLNRFYPADGRWVRLVEPEPDLPGNRINDSGVDPRGRFWFGTLKNNFDADNTDVPIDQSTGTLFSYDASKRLRRHVGGIGASNTVTWSPDGLTMYFGDTVAGAIFAFDFDADSGDISNRRLFAAEPSLGAPDGSAIDRDGYLWNCRLGAGCIVRFDPNGKIDRVLELPTQMVTSCAFGGAGLETLFVTTARFYLTPEALASQPAAGALLAVQISGVSGLELPVFAG